MSFLETWPPDRPYICTLGDPMSDPRTHFSGVRLQEGRVQLDSDTSERTAPKACGLYRALVRSAADPLGRGRLEVEVPQLLGSTAPWAVPCWPAGSVNGAIPPEGTVVWVAFEEGDVMRPVWLGIVE